jgi:hypothetical protein
MVHPYICSIACSRFWNEGVPSISLSSVLTVVVGGGGGGVPLD